ncbi:hypothetical protein Pelo_8160 [Pelomyxa schiedti]|nr:hypothetical protein Pelo_8160 [Pelomyxa schiedti]
MAVPPWITAVFVEVVIPSFIVAYVCSYGWWLLVSERKSEAQQRSRQRQQQQQQRRNRQQQELHRHRQFSDHYPRGGVNTQRRQQVEGGDGDGDGIDVGRQVHVSQCQAPEDARAGGENLHGVRRMAMMSRLGKEPQKQVSVAALAPEMVEPCGPLQAGGSLVPGASGSKNSKELPGLSEATLKPKFVSSSPMMFPVEAKSTVPNVLMTAGENPALETSPFQATDAGSSELSDEEPPMPIYVVYWDPSKPLTEIRKYQGPTQSVQPGENMPKQDQPDNLVTQKPQYDAAQPTPGAIPCPADAPPNEFEDDDSDEWEYKQKEDDAFSASTIQYYEQIFARDTAVKRSKPYRRLLKQYAELRDMYETSVTNLERYFSALKEEYARNAEVTSQDEDQEDQDQEQEKDQDQDQMYQDPSHTHYND